MQYISIWNACNLRCKFCYNDHNRLQRQFFLWLDELKSIAYNHRLKDDKICVVWWEPLAYSNIFDLLNYLESLNFTTIWLVTNWVFLSDITTVNKLLKYSNLTIQVSIHSNNEIIEQKISQREWIFEKRDIWINNLLTISDEIWYRLDLHSNTVANLININFIWDIIEYIKNLWIKNIHFSGMYNLKWLSNDNLDMVPMYSDIISQLSKILYLVDDRTINLKIHWIPLCMHRTIWNSNYQIRELQFNGFLNKDTWEIEKIKHKSLIDSCNICFAYWKYCNWPFNHYLDLYWSSEFNAISEFELNNLLEFKKYNK